MEGKLVLGVGIIDLPKDVFVEEIMSGRLILNNGDSVEIPIAMFSEPYNRKKLHKNLDKYLDTLENQQDDI